MTDSRFDKPTFAERLLMKANNDNLSNDDLVGTPSHKCDAAMPKQSLELQAYKAVKLAFNKKIKEPKRNTGAMPTGRL